MLDLINDFLQKYNLNDNTAHILSNILLVIIILLLCLISYLIARKVLLRIIAHYIMKSKIEWDNFLLERKVFHRLIQLIPAVIIYVFAPAFPWAAEWIQRLSTIYMILVILLSLDALLISINDIYMSLKPTRFKPVKTYVQVARIFAYSVASILILSTFLGKNPIYLLSGLGALSAVLMLVFKDSILGFVAANQLASNDMVRIGDWIEMPKYGADGDVVDISLNTVKVVNFDKTITTIPTYALISDSFKNWRGMKNAGGRRIKRAIYIDVSSVKFCTEEMIEEYRKYHFLSEYIDRKIKEINEYNRKHNFDPSVIVNGRRLTNLGTFRAYIQAYLDNNPNIHKGMTCMVRQLPPGEYGIPLEIYAFTNTTDWKSYENIQSDIFDHIIAVAPYFGLRLFQNPTGYDMRYGLNKSVNQASMDMILNS